MKNSIRQPRRPLLLATTLMALFSYGCATASKPKDMVPRDVTSAKRHPYQVSITVTGGEETNPLIPSTISNEDYSAALSEAVREAGLFSGISDTGPYRLEAFIANLSQPFMGLDLKVDLEVTYRLSEIATNRTRWNRTIKSSYTGTMGEAFAAVKRLRKANEGAARDNIKQAIQAMGQLHI